MSYLIFEDKIDFYLKSRYIEEIQWSTDFFMEFIAPHLDSYAEKKQDDLNNHYIKLFGDKDYLHHIELSMYNIEEEYFRIGLIGYRNIAMQLINLINIWEMQMRDLLNCTSNNNVIYEQLKEKYDYDVKKDLKLYEIINVANYLKHGGGGQSEKYLLNNASKYLPINDNNSMNFISSIKKINITTQSVIEFSKILINFWNEFEKVLDNWFVTKYKK